METDRSWQSARSPKDMSMYSPPLYISAKGGGGLEAATEAEEWRQFLFLGAVQLFWA